MSTRAAKSENSSSLIVRDVRKSFRAPGGSTIEVLCGVSFEARAGEMLAVRGASGAGKTTLLHVIGGLEEADAGECLLGDFNITRASSGDAARFRNREIGFVFQFHHLLMDLTAAENVAMPLLIARTSMKESLRLAHRALERVGLMQRTSHRVGELSGGEQQRVAVARAIVSEPKVVLADEPTGNLDQTVGDEIGALLATYCRERAVALLVATHNERLAALCHRVLYLEDGRLKESRGKGERG